VKVLELHFAADSQIELEEPDVVADEKPFELRRFPQEYRQLVGGAEAHDALDADAPLLRCW
jgi:hypothetical protein